MTNEIPPATRAQTGLIALTAIFIAALITSTLIGSKLVVIGPLTLSAGIVVFPFTFLSLDVIADCFGRATANKTVQISIPVQLFVIFFVWLGGVLPQSPYRPLGSAYAKMFSLAPRMVLASVIAFFVSQLFDVSIFLSVKERTQGKRLWLRTNVATLLSQLIDTAAFSAVFLGGVIPVFEIVKAGATVYCAKVALGFVNTPFVYLGRYLIRGKNADH